MAMDLASLTIEQALAAAIRSEMDSAQLYEKLNKMVKNFVLKDKLKFLIGEENKHKQILESLVSKKFSGKKLDFEKPLVPVLTLALKESATVPDLLEMAMEAEKVAEEYYDRLAEEVEDKGASEILLYLSSMEHGHYSLLKGEYELCLKDEHYYERGDFQYDMVHIGP